MTRVVVSDVQVLTAGTRYDQGKARDGQPIPTTVVTLLVTPSDAERIALAASEGEVMLTLRNPMDRKPTETTGVRTAALLGQPPAPAPVVRVDRPHRVVVEPVAAPIHVSRIYTVEAIRAAKRSEEVIR
jgi:pilus assembly protein CpaB